MTRLWHAAMDNRRYTTKAFYSSPLLLCAARLGLKWRNGAHQAPTPNTGIYDAREISSRKINGVRILENDVIVLFDVNPCSLRSKRTS